MTNNIKKRIADFSTKFIEFSIINRKELQRIGTKLPVIFAMTGNLLNHNYPSLSALAYLAGISISVPTVLLMAGHFIAERRPVLPKIYIELEKAEPAYLMSICSDLCKKNKKQAAFKLIHDRYEDMDPIQREHLSQFVRKIEQDNKHRDPDTLLNQLEDGISVFKQYQNKRNANISNRSSLEVG